MDKVKIESEVQSHLNSGQESPCPPNNGEAQNLEEPPPSYESAKSSGPQVKVENPEEIVAPVAMPQVHVVSVEYPEYEPYCEEYIYAWFLPVFLVVKKKGIFGTDCWVNLFIGAVFGWPWQVLHSMSMLYEPDFWDWREPVVTLTAAPMPSTSVPNKDPTKK